MKKILVNSPCASQELLPVYTGSWICLFSTAMVSDSTISAGDVIKKFKKTMSNKDSNYTEIK